MRARWAGETPALRRSPLSPFSSLLSFLQPLVEPTEDGLVPQPRVLGFENPMALVGVVEELARDAAALERGEQLHALSDGDAIVELAVDDERRSLEVLRGAV